MLVLSSLSFVPFHVLFVPLSFCVRVSVFLCLSRSLSLCPSCSFCVPRSLLSTLYSGSMIPHWSLEAPAAPAPKMFLLRGGNGVLIVSNPFLSKRQFFCLSLRQLCF